MAEATRTEPHHFFWRLLLAASLIAASVSLLTTGLGLNRYVSFPLAWSLALAVQLGLFGLAWLIGIGHDERRGLISALYCVTMLFSVTFSYVTLQSEFTENIRPAEARRRLFDASRAHLSENTRLFSEGVRRSEELELRLRSWVDMERSSGWSTRTCEEEEHCYLRGVCDRIRRRISRWEQESGRAYREGPGEQLIYGTLDTELGALRELGRRLGTYRDHLTNSNGVLASEIDNQERLRRLDGIRNQAPVADLAAVSCREVSLPEPPAYGDHARDQTASQEAPVYAFSDLVAILSAEHQLTREDYPTVFAFGLALFIDLFVLIVALGASVIEQQRGLPEVDGVPVSWEEGLQRDISGWIDTALLAGGRDPEARSSFLRSLIGAITFGRQGEARLIPETEEQRRFGHLLVQSKAARTESFVKYNRVGRMFLLSGWVYPALARHLSAQCGAAV